MRKYHIFRTGHEEPCDKNFVFPKTICYSKQFYVKKNKNTSIKMYLL